MEIDTAQMADLAKQLKSKASEMEFAVNAAQTEVLTHVIQWKARGSKEEQMSGIQSERT